MNHIENLTNAIRNNELETVKLLSKNEKKPCACCSPLVLALILGKLEMIPLLLLKHNATLNLTDDVGNTVLHYAMSSFAWDSENKELLEIIKLLIDHGADLYCENKQYATPISFLTENQKQKLFQYISCSKVAIV